MTRIAAIYHRKSTPISVDEIIPMMAAQPILSLHPGTVWHEGSVGLAHQAMDRKLDDGISSSQPYITREFAVVADLRLDNREKLRDKLGRSSSQTIHLSDIELLLSCYLRWGRECVKHLDGAFAFVIWDRRKCAIFAARDPIGEYGFCYYCDSSYLILATEVGQILAHQNVRPVLNDLLIAESLLSRVDTQDESYFQDIKICPPAHCLWIDRTNVRLWRYWDFDPNRQIRYGSDREYANHFRFLLNRSVQKRLPVTDRTGLMLSGGLDSSLLTALVPGLPQIQDGSLSTFSYAFEELTSCDERSYVEKTAGDLGLTVNYVPSDSNYLQLSDWPADPNGVNTNPLFGLIEGVLGAAQSAGCAHVMGGYYGDHLLAGGHMWVAEMLRNAQFGRLARHTYQYYTDIDWRSMYAKQGVWALLPNKMKNEFPRMGYRHRLKERASHLHPDLVQRTGILESLLQPDSTPFSEVERKDRYTTLFNRDLGSFFLAQRYYRPYGLQLIAPYADLDLIEFVFALPEEQLHRPGCTRWIQRNAMRDLVPEVVRMRPGKTSFYPLQQRFFLEQRDEILELLRNPLIVQKKYVREDWLQTVLSDPSAWLKRGRNATDLINCIGTEIWLRKMFGEFSLAKTPGNSAAVTTSGGQA